MFDIYENTDLVEEEHIFMENIQIEEQGMREKGMSCVLVHRLDQHCKFGSMRMILFESLSDR